MSTSRLLTHLSSPSKASRIPRTSDDLRELARRIAFCVIQGYMEHDMGHPEKAVEGFFEVYRHLFPEINPLRVHRAAELYVESLVKQDEIENTRGYSSDKILNDPRWDDVKSVLLKFAGELGLPESYATSTANFFRYHGVQDSAYVNHLLESEKIFSTALLGDSYWSKVLGSLYVLLVECHDKHDSTGLELGLQFAEKYFEIVLRAKEARQEKPLTSAA